MLGRHLRTNGRGKEPCVLFYIVANHPSCGPLHFPPELASTCRDGSAAESRQCGEVHRHVLRNVLRHSVVTGTCF